MGTDTGVRVCPAVRGALGGSQLYDTLPQAADYDEASSSTRFDGGGIMNMSQLYDALDNHNCDWIPHKFNVNDTRRRSIKIGRKLGLYASKQWWTPGSSARRYTYSEPIHIRQSRAVSAPEVTGSNDIHRVLWADREDDVSSDAETDDSSGTDSTCLASDEVVCSEDEESSNLEHQSELDDPLFEMDDLS